MAIRPDNFFDEPDLERGNVRRRGGNALLVPNGMPKDGPRAEYTPASKLSSYLTDLDHIRLWEKKILTRAMGQNEDLAALASVETYTTGFDKPTDQAGLRANAASGRRLNNIAERALDRARIHEKADYGTAVHSATEPGNTGIPVERMRDSVKSFFTFCQEWCIQILATEVFTANDTTMSAGTFDHLVRVPGFGVLISDKKTGGLDGQEFSVQLSGYANSDVYNTVTDERSDLEELAGDWINRQLGLIFHITDGKTEPYLVDLAVGWEAAKHAAWSRDYNAMNDILTPVNMKPIRQAIDRERTFVMSAIKTTIDDSNFKRLWEKHKIYWTDEHTEAVKARKAVL